MPARHSLDQVYPKLRLRKRPIIVRPVEAAFRTTLACLPPLARFPHSGMLSLRMAEKLDPNEIVTLEELALSNMWEITLSR